MYRKPLAIASALLWFVPSLIPALCAQQAAPTGSAAQAAPQPSPDAAPATAADTAPQPTGQSPSAQDQLPPELRPGHPLNPEDVDVLTGKRDRQIAAAQRANSPVLASPYGEFGYYGDYFWMNGRLGETWDIPMLPLSRISNPFFFGSGSMRGWRGRGFGGRR